MTRDDLIIKAMCRAMSIINGEDPDSICGFNPHPQWKCYEDAATAAFDAQHGLARVCPIEATEEMIAAYRGALKAQHNSMSPEEIKEIWPRRRIKGHGHVFPKDMKAHARWRAMSAAGDLTNPPEKK